MSDVRIRSISPQSHQVEKIPSEHENMTLKIIAQESLSNMPKQILDAFACINNNNLNRFSVKTSQIFKFPPNCTHHSPRHPSSMGLENSQFRSEKKKHVFGHFLLQKKRCLGHFLVAHQGMAWDARFWGGSKFRGCNEKRHVFFFVTLKDLFFFLFSKIYWFWLFARRHVFFL